MIVLLWGGDKHNYTIDMGKDWPGSRPPGHFRVIQHLPPTAPLETVDPAELRDEMDGHIVLYPLVGRHPDHPNDVLIYRHPHYPVHAMGRRIDL